MPADAPTRLRRPLSGHQLPNRGKTNDWLTPPHIIEALGPFDTDPCTPETMPWETAARRFTRKDDGLKQDWGTDRVWLNPPYSSEAAAWLAKLAAHGDGIALVFARTETAMWHDHVWPHASGLLFLAGRLHFHYPGGRRAPFNGGAPSVLIAYGESNADRLRSSGLAGAFARVEGRG